MAITLGVEAPARLISDEPVALTGLLAALSTALDLAEGRSENHAVRSCLIAMRLADTIGLDASDRGALFDAVLLKDLGGSSISSGICELFRADDRVIKRDLQTVDWSHTLDVARFVLSHVAAGASAMQKARHISLLARTGAAQARRLAERRCNQAEDIARDIGLSAATVMAIRHFGTHWNGSGHPADASGHEIPLLARIGCLAQTVDAFVTTEGLDEAYEVALLRRGTWFDPELVDALFDFRKDREFWSTTYGPSPRRLLERDEPDHFAGHLPRIVDHETLDRICLAFARVVDAKSTWTVRHSEAVSEITVGIAAELGYDVEMRRDLRLAALLHDLGKLGVSNLVLDKPDHPTDAEFEAIRRHPDLSERILRRVPGFERLADVAASHHERLDGRGYHRRLPGHALCLEARILAVADVYEALTAKRPYRGGFSRETTLDIMRKDVNVAFCPVAFEALCRWLDKTAMTPRVEAQLAAIEQAYAG